MTHRIRRKRSLPPPEPEEEIETSDEMELPDLEERGDDERADEHEALEKLSHWRSYLYALIPLVAVFFASTKEVWGLGTNLLLIGGLIVIAPPQRRLPAALGWGMLMFALGPLAGFLPGDTLRAIAPWRERLVQEWGIPLNQAVSVQTGVTLEAWVLAMCGLIWFGASIGQRHGEIGRRVIVRLLALGGVFYAVLAMLEQSKWLSIPVWWRDVLIWGEQFGPFLNRNHTSSFLAIASVLCAAAAYDAIRQRSRWFLLFLFLTPVPLIGILMNTSRAGLLLFFAGITVWMATSAMRKGFFRKVAVSTSLVIGVVSLILIMGGGLFSRFSAPGSSTETRLAIYQQTLLMATTSPWMGVGLGNFEYVFPQASQMHEPRVRYYHPESDLLWLLSEGGLLTLLPCLFIIWWLLKSTGPWFSKRSKRANGGRLDRRLRNAAAIGGAMALAHGLVDVPNHGLAYAAVTCVLFSVAVRPRYLKEAAGPLQSWGFRLAGLMVMGAGVVCWTGYQGNPELLPGGRGAKLMMQRADDLVKSGAIAESGQILDRVIYQLPMGWSAYYQRAGLKLYLRYPHNDALMDFGRARAVEPKFAPFCFEEGKIWTHYDPEMATIPWREYLRRYPESAPGRYGYFQLMLNEAGSKPVLRKELWRLANTIALKMQFLISAQTKEEWEACLVEVLKEQPDLRGFDQEQRQLIFVKWRDLGDGAELFSRLEKNLDWQKDGWRLLAENYAKNSDFKGAFELAAGYLPQPAPPATVTAMDVPDLERAYVFSPTDPRRGLELYYAYRAAGNLDGGLNTLHKVALLPNAPTYVKREMASIYAQKGEFRRAWELILESLRPA